MSLRGKGCHGGVRRYHGGVRVSWRGKGVM